jgi:hypothetical protein
MDDWMDSWIVVKLGLRDCLVQSNNISNTECKLNFKNMIL